MLIFVWFPSLKLKKPDPLCLQHMAYDVRALTGTQVIISLNEVFEVLCVAVPATQAANVKSHLSPGAQGHLGPPSQTLFSSPLFSAVVPAVG